MATCVFDSDFCQDTYFGYGILDCTYMEFKVVGVVLKKDHSYHLHQQVYRIPPLLLDSQPPTLVCSLTFHPPGTTMTFLLNGGLKRSSSA